MIPATPPRFAFVEVAIGRRRRLALWFCQVWEAMKEPVPKTLRVTKRLSPSDPEWESSLAFTYERHAIELPWLPINPS